MALQISIYPGIVTRIMTGGTAAVVIRGPVLGGLIQNPATAAAQGLVTANDLYVSLTGAAGLAVTGGTFRLTPGQTFSIPPYFAGEVSVNGAVTGHRFAAMFYVPGEPDQPYIGDFPPPFSGLQTVIKSYLYEQYTDDEDLQAFVAAFNAMAQEYVDWFNTINLPVYTQEQIAGALLDWVAAGLYGMTRPSLPVGGPARSIGPLGTFKLAELELGGYIKIGADDVIETTDDVFKRILTWHFFKGDGKVFDVRWLKRRVMRFLIGENGTAPNIDNTYPVSVTFGADNEININFLTAFRTGTGGSILGMPILGQFYLGEFESEVVFVPPTPFASVFKSAMDAGLLEMPFQFTTTVNLGE